MCNQQCPYKIGAKVGSERLRTHFSTFWRSDVLPFWRSDTVEILTLMTSNFTNMDQFLTKLVPMESPDQELSIHTTFGPNRYQESYWPRKFRRYIKSSTFWRSEVLTFWVRTSAHLRIKQCWVKRSGPVNRSDRILQDINLTGFYPIRWHRSDPNFRGP